MSPWSWWPIGEHFSHFSIYLLSRCPHFYGTEHVLGNPASPRNTAIYSREDAVPIYQLYLLAISIALRVRPRKLVTNSDPTTA